MDLRRLRAGEWIVGAAGFVLLVSLFLAWYDGQSGWESLGILDVILAFVALNALAIPFVTASYRVPALPLAHQSLTVLIGSVALLLVVGRVLNIPDWAEGREGGLWVGLLATLGVVAGGLLAMRDERRSPPGEHTDLAGVPVPGPPEIETLPAPRHE
jgi:drug/metabolite transporter (DMT)-like permease